MLPGHRNLHDLKSYMLYLIWTMHTINVSRAVRNPSACLQFPHCSKTPGVPVLVPVCFKFNFICTANEKAAAGN